MSERKPEIGSLVRPGAALRNFRNERGWTLAQLSEKTGLPLSTLSKIETDKTELTIDRLLRISLALDFNIADVFGSPTNQYAPAEANSRRSITRAGEGEKVCSKNGTYIYQAYDILKKSITPVVAEVHARTLEEFGEFHRHHGEEFVFVIEGELAVYTDTYTPAHLKAGDSIYFDSSMGHAYVAIGDQPCRIVSVFASSDEGIIHLLEGHADAQAVPGKIMPENTDR